ncbi:MAG: SO_0444 family Cu/Zn efflux transporter [Candidatus Omnitrophica bacterium]|nr:SO_0444 family Cu/Zn efflux transporter [Candidatus Omnitrophota bacterium]
MEILRGFLLETVNLFNTMSPYLLFGFLMAGLLKVFLKEDFVARHLGTHDFWSILKASIFGIPLPLCSCGVIPAALGLRKQGASKSAVFSFMISTPTTGVDSILATYALLGGFYAGFRVLATFIVAFIVGAAALLIKDVRKSSTEEKAPCPHCKPDPRVSANCCADDQPRAGSRLLQALRYGFYDLLRDSGRSILVGVFIGGAISYFLPVSFVEQYLGNVWVSMLVMLVLGIPMYVCSTGSIPVVAALMLKGLNPGAGFVFLITGPATNTVSFAVIAREFGVKSMLLFLGSLIAGSLLMGLVFNWAWGYFGLNFPELMRHHHAGGLPGWVNVVSSLVLAGCIIFSWQKPDKNKGQGGCL